MKIVQKLSFSMKLSDLRRVILATRFAFSEGYKPVQMLILSTNYKQIKKDIHILQSQHNHSIQNH
jgi:hypothetical protein